MSDYLSVTVRSHAGEPEAAFKSRLSAFWTHMLRNREADFEKVYAETTAFEAEAGTLTRQYLVEAEIADALEREFTAAGVGHDPIDRDEVYTKYEATPPAWMWIEH